ncbi:DUF222 domain-containing protein [Amnibacterium flavum]|nr:HNH endonuclease signature motif containing protein [Amnibacterium flavum]
MDEAPSDFCRDYPEQEISLDDVENGGYPVISQARYFVERIAERSTMTRIFQAEQLEYVDALRRQWAEDHGADWRDPDSLEWREFRAEVAAVLEVHERSAQSTIELARNLVNVFPSTLAGLRGADFSERHARILVEQSVGLKTELLAEYEARLLPWAVELIPSRFERLARQIRAELDSEAMVERHRVAVTERRIALEPAGDGMAWFGNYLAAEDGVAAMAVATGIAKGLLKVEGETRTLAQIESDVVRDMLLDGWGTMPPLEPGSETIPTPAARRGVTPEILVHVPVLTAMGVSDEPADLEGYGPIDAETARRIAGTAPGWLRMLTDPEDGAIVSFGRTTYRVPKQLRRFLEARDQVCRFVGCARSAKHCQADHATPWSEDGETVLANLELLCVSHHLVKERRRWKIGNEGTGEISWTSPTGRVYRTKPVRKFAPPGEKRMPRFTDPDLIEKWFEKIEETNRTGHPPF